MGRAHAYGKSSGSLCKARLAGNPSVMDRNAATGSMLFALWVEHGSVRGDAKPTGFIKCHVTLYNFPVGATLTVQRCGSLAKFWKVQKS